MNQPVAARYPSPFRYPGGKGKVVNFIKLLMLENGLVGHDYVEPFAGGASVALSLLFEDFADTIHINDINAGIYSFWNAAVTSTEELCERIETTPVTIESWHQQREIIAAGDPDPFDLGFATFFLNRTNRSGIIGGGVIGGLKQDGPWKLDARFNKPELIRRVRKIGRYRNRITVTRIDALAYLERWTVRGDVDAFLYLDPPYFVKGERLYDNFYGPEDHAAIARVVPELAHPWLVSYDAAPTVVGLYQSFDTMRYSLSYSASSSRGHGAEIMVFSPGLDCPDRDPGGIPTSDVLRAQLTSASL